MDFAGRVRARQVRGRQAEAERVGIVPGGRSGGELRQPNRLGAMRAMAVEFPEVHGHPNRLPFEGCLTLVDVASDRAPSGSRGHRVVLTRSAAEAALPSLLGMAVDYKAGWDGHDARQKCGIITEATLKDNISWWRGICLHGTSRRWKPRWDRPGTGLGQQGPRGRWG